MPSPGPCPHCGEEIAAGQTFMCNHCGGRFEMRKQAEPKQPTLEEWLEATPDDELSATLVRTYPGRTQADAAELMKVELEMLAARGYLPVTQSWADGRPGAGRVLALGLFASQIRPDGALTVTYARGGPATTVEAAPPRKTKRCPMCAEDVKAEAVICRFCRYEARPGGPGWRKDPSPEHD